MIFEWPYLQNIENFGAFSKLKIQNNWVTMTAIAIVIPALFLKILFSHSLTAGLQLFENFISKITAYIITSMAT